MNYYERHLGDYSKDTSHLTMIEHGAYCLLLDRYYGTESGIQADQVYRIARARTKEEKQAVDVVISEFFHLVDGFWINKRAEKEISKAKSRINAAKENGSKGGRPKKHELGSENETQQKPSGLFVGSENETQQKAYHIPCTMHHAPDNKQPFSVERVEVGISPPAQQAAITKTVRGSRLPADWRLPSEWGEWAMQEKPGWTTDDVRRCADMFCDYWHSASGKTATKADWQATWRNWVRREQGGNARASPVNSRDEGRRKVLNVLTGGVRNEQRSERDITGQVIRIAG